MSVKSVEDKDKNDTNINFVTVTKFSFIVLF